METAQTLRSMPAQYYQNITSDLFLNMNLKKFDRWVEGAMYPSGLMTHQLFFEGGQNGSEMHDKKGLVDSLIIVLSVRQDRLDSDS